MTGNTPDSAVAEVLREALIDEYQAIAVYQKVIDAFGPVRPFANIIEAERTHVQALLPLFARYGVPAPEDASTPPAGAPSSILEACRNAVEAEKANVAMYDRLLSAIEAPDVRAVLTRLQEASRDRHLPAFERCVARETGEGNGSGRGAGGGPSTPSRLGGGADVSRETPRAVRHRPIPCRGRCR